jgi:hypothetical protein
VTCSCVLARSVGCRVAATWGVLLTAATNAMSTAKDARWSWTTADPGQTRLSVPISATNAVVSVRTSSRAVQQGRQACAFIEFCSREAAEAFYWHYNSVAPWMRPQAPALDCRNTSRCEGAPVLGLRTTPLVCFVRLVDSAGSCCKTSSAPPLLFLCRLPSSPTPLQALCDALLRELFTIVDNQYHWYYQNAC